MNAPKNAFPFLIFHFVLVAHIQRTARTARTCETQTQMRCCLSQCSWISKPFQCFQSWALASIGWVCEHEHDETHSIVSDRTRLSCQFIREQFRWWVSHLVAFFSHLFRSILDAFFIDPNAQMISFSMCFGSVSLPRNSATSDGCSSPKRRIQWSQKRPHHGLVNKNHKCDASGRSSSAERSYRISMHNYDMHPFDIG